MPELLWSGVDTGTLEQIRDALDHADIAYNDETLEARLLYASMRHPLEVWVQRQDLEAAKRAVGSLFVPESVDPATSDESAADSTPQAFAASAGSDSPGSSSTGSSGDLDDQEEDENQFEDPPLVQVWNGDQADMARILKDCLRENGMRSQVIHEEAGKLGLWVHQKIEVRAKKIVREVLDATPPQ